MKKFILILFAVLVWPGLLAAQDRESAVMQALQEEPLKTEPVQTGFQWGDSIGGIRKTITELLEANKTLAEEYQSLTSQEAALQEQILQVKQQDQAIQEAIMARQMELLAPVDVGPLQDELFQARRLIDQEKKAVSVLRVRMKNQERRTSLLQLKIRGLELDKKAVSVQQQTRKPPAPFDGGPELARLKANLQALQDQETALQDRISEARLEIPERVREEEARKREMSGLESELSLLRRDRADLDQRIKERTALTRSLSFKRYRELLARQEAMTKRAEELRQQIRDRQDISSPETIEAQAPETSAVPEREADLKGLQAENEMLERQVGDLRENIAVLEYKINSLQRYKVQNKNYR